MTWRRSGRASPFTVLCAAFVQAVCGESGEELRIYASGPSVNAGEGADVRAYQLALRDGGDEAGPFNLKLVVMESGAAQTGRPPRRASSARGSARRWFHPDPIALTRTRIMTFIVAQT